MKRNWLLFALTALALAVTVGCEQPKPQVAEQTAAAGQASAQSGGAQGAVASTLSVNPNTLPPPRPALDNAPDLSGASLIVNAATLAKMEADGVPASVTEALKTLMGKEFSNAEDFAEAVRGAAPGSDAHIAAILRNALVVSLADEPRAPEGELSISARQEAAASSAQFGVVYFEYDKSNIRPEFEQTIQANADLLLANASMRVTVEGHCDERGTNEYNLALGQRRAEAVRRALIAKGVPAKQLATISYGEERPEDSGHTEEAWAKNRRAAIVAN